MHQPPASTVTFLFTDIEGSTKLWEQHPDAMRSALARHDQLLRQAITENGGHVFKTVGDAFCATFATAPNALQAALAAQLSLFAESWGLPTPLRVRIALHTGSVEERDGDYFGPPLNRIARLLMAGHGGQTLLSLAAQELTRDALPPMTSFLDLGNVRLKDLSRPEHVFQLLHLSLPANFPPLHSLESMPNNLPQQPTSFIGRDKELGEVKALLARTRLLTLTGTGGSGKTRLSLQAATDLLDQYAGGVWLVKLASLTDPVLVPQAVADALGVREEAGKPSMRTLVDWLRPKRLLLVLDNCEHLVSACAALATDLLQECPQIHLLTSSREPLNVSGEQTYRVPSLSLPDPKKTNSAEALSQYEAVSLFIERARAVRPEFAVTDANAPAVAQVCFHLDGIPLAIELAAVRVRSLSVEDINARLDNRFHLLTGGTRDKLPRQQTLRALVDWSYDLLTEQEKTLLQRLSVFAGGWTLMAAEDVGSGECASGAIIEKWQVLDLLDLLVEKSLAVYEESADGQARYRLLETIRHYGLERVRAAGEEHRARQKHLNFFLWAADEYELQQNNEYLHERVRCMQTEVDNLRAALAHSRADVQVALRLAGTLRIYWIATNKGAEGREHLEAALSLPGARRRTTARAKALIASAMLHDKPDSEGGRLACEEALSISRELVYEEGIALALLGLGDVVSKLGDYETARTQLEESLALSLKLGYQMAILWALNFLGRAALRHGHAADARQHWERAVDLARKVRQEAHIVWTLSQLAMLNRVEGQQEKALTLAEESLELARVIGDRTNLAWVAEFLAELCANNGEFERALRLLTEAEEIGKSEGFDRGVWPLILMTRVCIALEEDASAQAYLTQSLGRTVFEDQTHLVGWLPQYQGDLALACENRDKARLFYRESLTDFWAQQEVAGVFVALSGLSATEEAHRVAHLHGAAQALSETDRRVGFILKSHERQRQMYANAVAASRAAQSDEAFTAALDAGRAMTLEQAVEYALREHVS